jgi:hypothetical protein
MRILTRRRLGGIERYAYAGRDNYLLPFGWKVAGPSLEGGQEAVLHRCAKFTRLILM